jgi:hypothetical protein
MPIETDENALIERIKSHFECKRCGNCCKGEGLVKIDAVKAQQIADLLEMPLKKFLKTFAVKYGRSQWILKDRFEATPRGREQWCIFLERDPDGLYKCRINAAKPAQCAGFPHDWRNDDTMDSCAGMRAMMTQWRRERRAGSSMDDTG